MAKQSGQPGVIANRAEVNHANRFYAGGMNNPQNVGDLRGAPPFDYRGSPYGDMQTPVPRVNFQEIPPQPPGIRVNAPPEVTNAGVASASWMGNAVLPAGMTSPALQQPPSPIITSPGLAGEKSPARVATSAGTPAQLPAPAVSAMDLEELKRFGLPPGHMPKGRRARPIS